MSQMRRITSFSTGSEYTAAISSQKPADAGACRIASAQVRRKGSLVPDLLGQKHESISNITSTLSSFRLLGCPRSNDSWSGRGSAPTSGTAQPDRAAERTATLSANIICLLMISSAWSMRLKPRSERAAKLVGFSARAVRVS